MENKKAKTVIIGLDGGTFDFINPLLAENKLPNIKRIIDNGCHGTLKSTMPPITPPAWTSFYTGKNPGKHGVYGFCEYTNEPDNNNFSLSSLNSVKSPTLWNMFGKHDMSVCLINLPMTYPPPEVNGVCISGLGTPDSDSEFTFPKSLKSDIFNKFPDFRYIIPGLSDKKKNRIKYLGQSIEQEGIRKDLFLELTKKDDYDLSFIVFGLTDIICHQCWRFHDDKELISSAGLDDSPINLAYIQVDSFIGEIMESVDKDTNVIFMSDHGFGKINKFFFVNNWLKEQGYLKIKKFSIRDIRKQYRLIWKYFNVQRIIEKIGLRKLAHILPGKIRDFDIVIPLLDVKGREKIDWSRTTAYAENFGIYINLKGRESTGIVDQGKDYEELRKEITAKLQDLKDPETGKSIISYATKKEDVYSGPSLPQACDIVFEMADSYWQVSHCRFKGNFRKVKNGNHKMLGLFMAYGPSFKKGFTCENAQIYDVTPTILAMHGLPISEHLDGKALTECFDPTYFESLDIKIEKGDDEFIDGDSASAYTEEELQRVNQHLKALGYL